MDAIAGGGGLLSFPAILALGLTPAQVLGTNKLIAAPGTAVSVWRFYRNRLIDPRIAGFAFALTLLGSWLGAAASSFQTKRSFTMILLAVIPVVIFLNYLKDRRKRAGHPKQLTAIQISWRAALCGFALGFYDGVFGPGTGTFLMIAFVFSLGLDYRSASVQARVVNLGSNLAAFVFFFSRGEIVWAVGLAGIAGGISGNYLGSGMLMDPRRDLVKPLLYFVLGLLMVKCAWDLVG